MRDWSARHYRDARAALREARAILSDPAEDAPGVNRYLAALCKIESALVFRAAARRERTRGAGALAEACARVAFWCGVRPSQPRTSGLRIAAVWGRALPDVRRG